MSPPAHLAIKTQPAGDKKRMKLGIYLNSQHPIDRDPAHCWAETLEQVRFARKLGFDSIWGGEHHITPGFHYFPLMPMLQRLREAGFSVWPFDPPGLPAVVEIYPRAFTGHMNKSSREARLQFLKKNFSGLAGWSIRTAASCDDAFDAAVSALAMDRRSEDLMNLTQAIDRSSRLEGKIWY